MKPSLKNRFGGRFTAYKVVWNIEHEILHRMLHEKRAVRFLSTRYGLPKADIVKIYKQLVLRVNLFAKKLRNIQRTKKQRMRLRRSRHSRIKEKLYNRFESALLDRKISDSTFPFTNRMRNMLQRLDFFTIRELTECQLETYPKFRGFKTLCMNELIDFIIFENLQGYFKGFRVAKNKYQKLRRN